MHEHALVEDQVPNAFATWSNGSKIAFCQGSLQGSPMRPTKIITNLDLGYLGGLGPSVEQSQDRRWTVPFRRAISWALEGRSPTPSLEVLDQLIKEGLKENLEKTVELQNVSGNEVEEEDEALHQVKELSPAQLRLNLISGNAMSKQGIYQGSMAEMKPVFQARLTLDLA